MKYATHNKFSTEIRFVKTSTRIMKYESWAIKLNLDDGAFLLK